MIRYETRGSACYITLDTPETSNKFTYQLMCDFIDALTAAKTSGAFILVIRATGEHFTLGRDQSEQLPHIDRRVSLGLILKANAELRRFPGVSIALIQGRAMGFGTGLALHCDISIGADDSVLGFDEIKYGLAPLIVMNYLPAHVGQKIASELIYTGRDVSAIEAVRLGLLNRTAPSGELSAIREALVAELSAFKPGAIRLLQRYRQETEAVETNAPQLGIDMLADWLKAGRPD